ncbi:MAG: lytic murein transglycosylase [Hyphomicrobiales bacterium]|nr:lytic murein transglycosylase [Hyphomicrobiales bacterium]
MTASNGGCALASSDNDRSCEALENSKMSLRVRPYLTLVQSARALALVALAIASAGPQREANAKPTGIGRSPAAAPATPPQMTGNSGSFAAFIETLWPEAKAAGVSRATFDAAFAGVQIDPKVLERTKEQAEFERTIRDYLASAVSERQVEEGRALAAKWRDTLDVIERRFGVDRYILIALWGLESNYGAGIGGKDVISSLASLAFIDFRGGLFRDELIDALVILEHGHVARAAMKGSWAGAMGQAQFMPSSFMKYAIAFDGGTRKDIWTNPQDVLASIANFLKMNSWRTNLPASFEVTLPASFSYLPAQASFAEWKSRGVSRPDGEALPSGGEALLFFPVGSRGPAFLITENFFVLKNYNTSDSYALAAGLLAERIRGSRGIHASWPSVIERLDHGQRLEAQKLLQRLGLYDDKLDGHLGPALREATRRFQAQIGLVPDGFPTPLMLERLRGALD